MTKHHPLGIVPEVLWFILMHIKKTHKKTSLNNPFGEAVCNCTIMDFNL